MKNWTCQQGVWQYVLIVFIYNQFPCIYFLFITGPTSNWIAITLRQEDYNFHKIQQFIMQVLEEANLL